MNHAVYGDILVYASFRRPPKVFAVFLAFVAATASAISREPDASIHSSHKRVKLVPNAAKTSFDFETDQMRGTIRGDGAYHGIASLVDKETQQELIHPNISALNLYRMAASSQVLGIPRMMERTIRSDGEAVEIRWEMTGDNDEAAARRHVAEVSARYEVYEPNLIELTVTVRALRSCPGFEVFVPNYFDKSLEPKIYLQPRGYVRGVTPPELVTPTVNDAFRGTLLVFPRDDHAARMILDGRWDRDSEVQPSPVRHFARSVAILAHPEQHRGVVIMARPQDAFAISARYHADRQADRLTPYSAFDFSLFGVDLLPGDVHHARVRLALTPLDDQMSQSLELYKSFLAETNETDASIVSDEAKN